MPNNIVFPYCNDIDELNYRIVLTEKMPKSRYSFPIRCCTINGIAIFTDKDKCEEDFIMGTNGFDISYVMTGTESVVVMTDSTVIQKIVKIIDAYV